MKPLQIYIAVAYVYQIENVQRKRQSPDSKTLLPDRVDNRSSSRILSTDGPTHKVWSLQDDDTQNLSHFEEKFSVKNESKGRPFGVTKDVNIVEAIRQSTDTDPKKSIRQLSGEMNLSRMTVKRILRRELKLYPYVISMRYKMTAQD